MALSGKRIAILVGEGFEDLEFYYPYYRLLEEGAEVTVVGVDRRSVCGKYGHVVVPDASIGDVRAEDFDGLVLPGGKSPENLRIHEAVVDFVRRICEAGKPVAAICHGPQLLISAGVLRGRTVTCVKKIRDDVVNAGAKYVDEPVVRDGNIVTSRVPSDLPHFCREFVRLLKES